jgi:uncharacterized protein with PIN domain
MKHKDVMEDIAGNDKSTCDGELEYITSEFTMDVDWWIYRCKKCGKEVWDGARWKTLVEFRKTTRTITPLFLY